MFVLCELVTWWYKFANFASSGRAKPGESWSFSQKSVCFWPRSISVFPKPGSVYVPVGIPKKLLFWCQKPKEKLIFWCQKHSKTRCLLVFCWFFFCMGFLPPAWLSSPLLGWGGRHRERRSNRLLDQAYEDGVLGRASGFPAQLGRAAFAEVVAGRIRLNRHRSFSAGRKR